MDRELKGNGYAVIPAEYVLVLPPTTSGIYDKFGRLVKPKLE